jgi:hypothetical protein
MLTTYFSTGAIHPSIVRFATADSRGTRAVCFQFSAASKKLLLIFSDFLFGIAIGLHGELPRNLISIPGRRKRFFRITRFLDFVHGQVFQKARDHNVSATGFVSVLR